MKAHTLYHILVLLKSQCCCIGKCVVHRRYWQEKKCLYYTLILDWCHFKEFRNHFFGFILPRTHISKLDGSADSCITCKILCQCIVDICPAKLFTIYCNNSILQTATMQWNCIYLHIVATFNGRQKFLSRVILVLGIISEVIVQIFRTARMCDEIEKFVVKREFLHT